MNKNNDNTTVLPNNTPPKVSEPSSVGVPAGAADPATSRRPAAGVGDRRPRPPGTRDSADDNGVLRGEKGNNERARPRERPRKTRKENGRVYSGRPGPTTSKRGSDSRSDPPVKGPWPDMNMFRSLLRNEAGLRLQTLGYDWSDVFKEESDWRLDLYKNWLWTLNNGVGSPVVESRSDRMRRRTQRTREPRSGDVDEVVESRSDRMGRKTQRTREPRRRDDDDDDQIPSRPVPPRRRQRPREEN
jgi:hypothetical protein